MGQALGQSLDNERSLKKRNPRLRLERLARKWGQDDVASGLLEIAALLGETPPGIDASLVSKWERGVRNPGDYYTPRLCLLFQLPPERLGFVPTPSLASKCRTLSEALGKALARTLGTVRRRALLQHLLWSGALLAGRSVIDAERLLAAASGKVDQQLVDDLHTVADDHARQMHSIAPRDLLPQVEQHLAYVQSMLRNRRATMPEGHLHLIAATLAAVAGRLSFYVGNPGDAYHHYTSAEGHARQAGEGPLQAYVLGQRSWLYSDLRPDGLGMGTSVPLRLLDEARAAASGRTSPWLHTWLSACRAAEHASRGDARSVHRDLEEAERSLNAALSTNDALFAHWSDCPTAYLAVYRGNCLALLGHAEEAVAVIEDAIAGLSPSLVSVRCSVLVDLATAYEKDGNVEHACGLLSESLELSSERALGSQLQRVVGIRKQHLTDWHDVPAVHHLDEQLHELALAAG